MARKYVPDAECVAAATDASEGKLGRADIDAAFQTLFDYRSKLEAEGDITTMGDKLRSFAERQAERTRIAATVKRRHAAINVLVRDRRTQQLEALFKAGLRPDKAMLAILEGTQKGVDGGRVSVNALRLGYEGYYAGEMLADLHRIREGIQWSLGDARLDADIVREMMQMRKGGKPGITGNSDALSIARVFAAHAERARTTLNALGASIGKLDGWFGVQIHDDVKMLRAGKSAWVRSVRDKLDINRTFGDAPINVDEALGRLFGEFVTDFKSRDIDEAMGSGRTGPANLANTLGEHRVLHFKSPEDALAYRSEFGYGNTFSGMVAHLRRSARMSALIDALGPNPEAMWRNLARDFNARIAGDESISIEKRNKWTSRLKADAGALRQAFDISSGLASRPDDVTAARIFEDIRGLQRMAKLNTALFSSVNDTVTGGLASMYRGSGFFNGFAHHFGAIFAGRPKGEQAELAFILGEGADGMLGQMATLASAEDGPRGMMARLQDLYFRMNGQTWWTDVQRAAAGRMIAAEAGLRSTKQYDALPDAYRHVLSLHGIDATKWDAIRKAVRVIDGKTYLTPDLIRQLPDDVVAQFTKIDLGDNDAMKAAKLSDARRNLELDYRSFIADETNYAVIEPDDRTRRFTTRGTRPGTFFGELARLLFQFKQFPIAMTQRVLGRQLFGYRKSDWVRQLGHFGTLMAGMTLAGYVSMTAKDAVKGYWPPRSLTDPEQRIKTLQAAFLQGGAAGIFGDFLFSQYNRYGGSPLETFTGPVIGTASQLGGVLFQSRDASMNAALGIDDQFPAAQALNLAVSNAPFVGLPFVKPALDALFLNAMREAASPGYTRRTNERRRLEYGQRPIGDYLSEAVR